jgi:hypothetical protein
MQFINKRRGVKLYLCCFKQYVLKRMGGMNAWLKTFLLWVKVNNHLDKPASLPTIPYRWKVWRLGRKENLYPYWEMNFISASCGPYLIIILSYKVTVFFSIIFIHILELHLHRSGKSHRRFSVNYHLLHCQRQ